MSNVTARKCTYIDCSNKHEIDVTYGKKINIVITMAKNSESNFLCRSFSRAIAFNNRNIIGIISRHVPIPSDRTSPPQQSESFSLTETRASLSLITSQF